MTLKFKRPWNSKKGVRRLRGVPAVKRLGDALFASSMKRRRALGLERAKHRARTTG